MKLRLGGEQPKRQISDAGVMAVFWSAQEQKKAWVRRGSEQGAFHCGIPSEIFYSEVLSTVLFMHKNHATNHEEW